MKCHSARLQVEVSYKLCVKLHMRRAQTLKLTFFFGRGGEGYDINWLKFSLHFTDSLRPIGPIKNFHLKLGYCSVIFQTFLLPENVFHYYFKEVFATVSLSTSSGCYISTLISKKKFANISFVLKFMQLIIPLLFYQIMTNGIL